MSVLYFANNKIESNARPEKKFKLKLLVMTRVQLLNVRKGSWLPSGLSRSHSFFRN